MPYTDKQLAKHREAMALGEAIPVELVTRQGQRSSGELRLWRLTDADRSKRALKWLLTCGGIGVVAILCPPHFLWLIVALLVGIVGYVQRGREKERLLGGEAPCPKCGKPQLLDPASMELPLLHFCTECGVRCVVDRASAVS